MIDSKRSARRCRRSRRNGILPPLALRVLLRSIAIAMIAGAPAFAAAAQDGAPVASAAPASPFPAEAGKLGVRKCANVYSALGQMVSHGSNYAVRTQTEPTAPDAHTVHGLLGMTYSGPDHNGQAAGVVLAAPVGSSCEGQLVRVAPFEQPCADTVRLLPAGSAGVADLSGVPLYELGGNQGQALLVSSGTGCVVVTVARAAQVP